MKPKGNSPQDPHSRGCKILIERVLCSIHLLDICRSELELRTPVAVDELCEATSGRAAAVKRARSKDREASSLLQLVIYKDPVAVDELCEATSGVVADEARRLRKIKDRET